MLIEKKENYKLIYSDENSFSKFYSSFLKKEKEFDKETFGAFRFVPMLKDKN